MLSALSFVTDNIHFCLAIIARIVYIIPGFILLLFENKYDAYNDYFMGFSLSDEICFLH